MPGRKSSHANQLRIIGGKFRGRKLSFPDQPGLRPTGDRIRETLFNWLTPHIHDITCLDLFAGSGALGFEALSRGAREVILVDQSETVCRYLRTQREILGVPSATVHCRNSMEMLQHPERAFDLVFVDPPFDASCLEAACASLECNQWIVPNGLVYLEYPLRHPVQHLPDNWQLYKDAKAGQVGYRLYRRT